MHGRSTLDGGLRAGLPGGGSRISTNGLVTRKDATPQAVAPKTKVSLNHSERSHLHAYSADDGFAEFQQNMIAVLPPPKYKWCTELGVGPGVPHLPPYKHEIYRNLDRTDFRESLVFREPELSPPNGV